MEKLTKIEKLIADGILLKYKIIWIRLILEDKNKKVILNL